MLGCLIISPQKVGCDGLCLLVVEVGCDGLCLLVVDMIYLCIVCWDVSSSPLRRSAVMDCVCWLLI